MSKATQNYQSTSNYNADSLEPDCLLELVDLTATEGCGS